jgi:peptidyl-prolyl cis-trans isomerase A (cyclophilin A)
MTIVVSPIRNIVVPAGTETAISPLNLINNFDDPLTTGLVARFELYDTSLGGGVADVVLFDQAGAGAPQTVRNFQNYVNDGDYVNSFIHRSVPGFVVQGGGFTLDNAGIVGTVPTDAPVQNEFSAARSNVRGTIAMAKLGSNPDSATSQWFFNLADNAANLNNQNGGFTVFGELQSTADLAVVDAIAALPVFNASGLNPAFTNLPLSIPLGSTSPPAIDDFVRFRSITIAQFDELEFSVVNNTNPDLVNAVVSNNQLLLSYTSGLLGSAEITIRATNLLGDTLDDTFQVTIGANQIQGTTGNDVLRGQSGVDELLGLEGNDRLLGRGGNDILVGDRGKDTLQGGNGDDDLDGGAGSDRLDGDKGNDLITTGGGSDILIIGPREGLDTVTDFGRRDRIFLGKFSTDRLTLFQLDGGTLIQAGRIELLFLADVTATDLTEKNFITRGS